MMRADRIGERLEALLHVHLRTRADAFQYILDGLVLELYLTEDRQIELERHIADMEQRWAGVG